MVARIKNKYLPKGFTLLELMITITILALIVGIAIPSYNNFIVGKRIRTGTEELYDYIKMAQSQAVTTKANFYLTFKPGTAWCYGLSDSSNTCDCSSTNSCTVNNIETVIKSTNYPGQALSIGVSGFSGSSTSPYITFNGIHSTLSNSGSVTISLAGKSTIISVNTMGLVSVCSNGVSGYSSCSSP